MYKILIVSLVALLLTGCATTPPPHPQHKECDVVSNYARGIEVLKQVGVSQADTNSFVSQPSVAQFPMQRVRSLVYLKTFETPAHAYMYFYDMCVTIGHQNLLGALENAEQQHLRSLAPTTPPTKPTKTRGKK